MVRMVAALVATAILLLVVLWALQRQLIYLPSPGPVPSAGQVLPRGQDVTLETTVLVANGNGGDRGMRAPLALALSRHGLGVLLFDYRGYGGNPGSPSQEGLELDVRSARDYLVREAGVPPARLLYLGESLGSAVVTELATEQPPAGMVLRSPFVDLASVARVHYPYLPVGLLLRDRFPLVQNLERVRVPLVVVYGTADDIVPPGQSREVARTAPNLARVVAVEGVGHNDVELLNGPQLVDAVVDLAQRVTSGR
jgi:pimeloyl-ACP methyl ester carboxylesterase